MTAEFRESQAASSSQGEDNPLQAAYLNDQRQAFKVAKGSNVGDSPLPSGSLDGTAFALQSSATPSHVSSLFGYFKSTDTDPSAPYRTIIDEAASQIYDPKSLGDLKVLRHQFDSTIHTSADVVAKANEALKRTNDKYNHVLSQAEWQDLQSKLSGEQVGIGMRLFRAPAVPGAIGRDLVIDEVLPNSPALSAGLKEGDRITAIDGKVLKDTPPDQVELSGDAGSKLDITIARDNQTLTKDIERKKIDVPVVSQPKDLGNGISYIQIFSFERTDTASELKAAMEKSDAKAFVIDVRDNPGGQVEPALSAAQLFVKDGTIMTERWRVPSDPASPQYVERTFSVDDQNFSVSERRTDKPDVVTVHKQERMPYVDAGRPVVLLTNGNSASAAEIFTGALHDTGHATTVGETTFGKGIEQILEPGIPEGGALKLTGAHYETPSHVWPGDAQGERHGLVPDLSVAYPENAVFRSKDDTQLSAAVAALAEKLQPKEA